MYACTPKRAPDFIIDGCKLPMWLLGIELRTSGRGHRALNLWAISPTLADVLLMSLLSIYVDGYIWERVEEQSGPADGGQCEWRSCHQVWSSSETVPNLPVSQPQSKPEGVHPSSQTNFSWSLFPFQPPIWCLYWAIFGLFWEALTKDTLFKSNHEKWKQVK